MQRRVGWVQPFDERTAGRKHSGRAGSKERVDFGKVIGSYVDPVTGEKIPTTKGIIHYGSKGVHIVPSRT